MTQRLAQAAASAGAPHLPRLQPWQPWVQRCVGKVSEGSFRVYPRLQGHRYMAAFGGHVFTQNILPPLGHMHRCATRLAHLGSPTSAPVTSHHGGQAISSTRTSFLSTLRSLSLRLRCQRQLLLGSLHERNGFFLVPISYVSCCMSIALWYEDFSQTTICSLHAPALVKKSTLGLPCLPW